MANPQFQPVQINTANILKEVAKGVDAELAKKLRLWARTVDKNISRGAGLEKMHRDVGEGARQKVLAAYRGSGIGERPSYRTADRGKFRRYANGKMEEAIQNPGTIRYDKGGILFVDKSEMDRFARQWYRLNFGTTGGNNKSAPSARPMTIFGVTTSARATLENNQPSHPFLVPAGWWSGTFAPATKGARLGPATGRGQDAFYVRRKNAQDNPASTRAASFSDPRTGNISGKRFLDQGASYINQQYPRKLEALMNSWLKGK